VIVVQQSSSAALRMRIFNADGSEAEACGNGLRCFTKYAVERNIASKISRQSDTANNGVLPDTICISIETMAGIRNAQAYLTDGVVELVKVSMGVPGFEAYQIPISATHGSLVSSYKSKINNNVSTSLLNSILTIEKKHFKVWTLSMGNPHAVTFLSEPVSDFPLEKIGPGIENNSLFPKRTNFEIARVLDNKTIEARVWERGVGETLACGSGACAIAVASMIRGYTGHDVDIILSGGTLHINWDGTGEVNLTGPVKEVFTGKYTI